MYTLEISFWANGGVVCGIDEAGRGPLAGPVCAAAVILNPNDTIEGLNDSKKLSEKKRELLFEEIKNRAIAYSIAFADHNEIDELNIIGATYLAMNRAFDGVKANNPTVVLVDGNGDPKLGYKTECIVKGDQKSASIAAASIMAKVTRDRFMVEMAKKYPEYLFDIHKGYPTKKHSEIILEIGPCPIHRTTFLKKLLGKKNG